MEQKTPRIRVFTVTKVSETLCSLGSSLKKRAIKGTNLRSCDLKLPTQPTPLSTSDTNIVKTILHILTILGVLFFMHGILADIEVLKLGL